MTNLQQELDDLDRAVAQNPDDTRTMAQRGETCRLLGRYAEALADFSRAIELDPNYAWALAHRGETYHLLEQYPEALTDFDRAIALTPEHAWALAHRGVTYRRLRQYPPALADLNRAIELKPDYAWALLHRVNVHITLRNYAAALADVDRGTALDPSLVPHAQGERGLLLNYMGRYAETIALCRPAVQENANDYIAWYSLAAAKALAQGVAAAHEDITNAQAASLAMITTADKGPAMYRLGGLAALLGQTEQALDYLQAAIAAHPEPLELAWHDPVWFAITSHARFQELIA